MQHWNEIPELIREVAERKYWKAEKSISKIKPIFLKPHVAILDGVISRKFMQNLEWCINNIDRCKGHKKEIDIHMAVLRNEREVIDVKQIDLEIILNHYNHEKAEIEGANAEGKQI